MEKRTGKMSNELQELKNEIAGLATRMDNVEGYFDNFNATLENHMTDYRARQESIDKKVNSMEGKLSWAFWVIFGLLTAVLTGLIGSSVVLLQRYLGG